jgi:1,4-alpha-glucan branching enzyme
MSDDIVERLRSPPMVAGSDGLRMDAATEIVRLRATVQMGIKMRERQKAYFKTRTKDDLIASKQAEAAFDRAAKEA